MSQENPLYTPKIDIVNRERYRKFYHEAMKVEEFLGEVEQRFYEQLFNEEDTNSYKQLYDHYLSQFEYNFDWVMVNCKLRVTNVNSFYFVQHFSPIEVELDGPRTIKRMWDDLNNNIFLSLSDCDGMCNHCENDHPTLFEKCKSYKN